MYATADGVNDDPEVAREKKRVQRAATRELLKQRRATERGSVLRLEIATAVNRTILPPDNPHAVKVVPFGVEEAWLPPMIHHDAEGKRTTAPAPSNRLAFMRVLDLIQQRVCVAGNAVVADLWIRRHQGENALGQALETAAYQKMRDGLIGGEGPYAVPHVTRAVYGELARRIYAFCSKVWKHPRNRHAVPALTADWPVWVRGDGWKFTRADGLNLAVNLDGTWWEIGLRAPRKDRRGSPDQYVMGTLRRLKRGESDRGVPAASPTADKWIPTCIGFQKPKNNGKWMVLIQYRQPKRVPIEVPNVLVVHCGLKNYVMTLDLASACGRGRGRSFMQTGIEVDRMRARFRARRRDLQRTARLRPHGRGHVYQAERVDLLRGKEEAWVDTWLRRLAARVVRDAVGRRAAIHFADLKNIRLRAENSDLPKYVKIKVHQAPWFKLREYVAAAAEKARVPFHLYDPRYHTQRCPRCGTISASAPNYRTWQYVCLGCGHRGHLDRIGGENALLDLGVMDRVQFPDDSVYERVRQDIRDAALLAGLNRAQPSATARPVKKRRKRRGLPSPSPATADRVTTPE